MWALIPAWWWWVSLGEGADDTPLALGTPPHLAARLQGLAAPQTVVLSAATYRLVQGWFACQALGTQLLQGFAQPVTIYRVLGDSGVQSRLEVASARGLTPLVGREREVGLLLERWAQVKDGQGQVVVLSGEAGIGKSRLVQVVKEHIAGEPHVCWECRGSPYHQHSAMYPVIDLLQRALRVQRDDTPLEKLRKLEEALAAYGVSLPKVVPLLASLLSVLLRDNNLSPEEQKQQTIEALVTLLLTLAARQPVLIIVEDLHWVDPSTLELLSLLIDQVPAARVGVLLTCRPEFRPPWGLHEHLTLLTLGRLSSAQVEQMVEYLAQGKTPAGRSARADRHQDRWSASLCRRIDHYGTGVSVVCRAWGPGYSHRLLAPTGHSRDAVRFAHSASGSARGCQRGGATWDCAGADVFL